MRSPAGHEAGTRNHGPGRGVTRNSKPARPTFGLKISKAGALYTAITLLLGFAAVNTGNNLLFLIVSGLLAFMSVTGLAGMQNLKHLSPELIAPAEIFAGVRAPFRLRLHNGKSWLPSFLIRVQCHDGQGFTFPVVPPRGVVEGSVGLTFQTRGMVSIGQISLGSPFPVNFFIRYWHFSLPVTCLVFPRLLPGRSRGNGSDQRRQGYALRQERGTDGELERIAPYSGSEPLRLIHWKLSARGDEFMIKEFGCQAATPLVIDPEDLPGSTCEERLSQAAWLVKHWIQTRPVGLTLKGRAIPAAHGHRHGVRLLTELALYGN